MRRSLLAIAVSAFSIFAASAADLRQIPNYEPPPIFTWTGFYVGLSAGGIFDQSNLSYPAAPIERPSHSAASAFGGGQIGYNYQISSFVLGLQGDALGTGLKGSGPCGNPAFVCSTKENWIASLTGRAGYAFDRALVYVKGGVAFTSISNDGDSATSPASNEHANGSLTGWTVGAGVQYAVLPHWSGFIEYDHYDFGTANLSSYRVATGAFFNLINIKQTVDLVKVGVNYGF